ncbi:hypothetical protein HAX54_006452 [Datura stramonium]|uniref:Gag protein n=1 Tax=Datura stramonium TaxID=4076 RepID=A0ABS8TBM2_DATST|nr:hypothetical protein [Datura stramonium]
MARTRNSDNNAPATAVVGSSVAQGRAKKVPAKNKGRPAKATPLPQARQTEQVVQEQVPQLRPATIPAQVVMPLEMGEAFNAVKGAMEMFTTFMANQGKREDQTQQHTGRRDGSMFSRVKEFINLDPPEFCGTKPEKDPILWLGDHIQDTNAAAAVSMEAFASAVGFAKFLEGKKQKQRVRTRLEQEGPDNRWTSGSLPGRHSQGNGSQSRQNQNFRTPVSQSQLE